MKPFKKNDRREVFPNEGNWRKLFKDKLERGQEILKTNELRFSRTLGISKILDSFQRLKIIEDQKELKTKHTLEI